MVEVVDPGHPRSGLSLPLMGVTAQRAGGPVCLALLGPHVERRIPAAATNLGAVGTPSSRCWL